MTNPNMTLAELATEIFVKMDRFDDVFETLPNLVGGIAEQNQDIKSLHIDTRVESPQSARITFILEGKDGSLGSTYLALSSDKEGLHYRGPNDIFKQQPLNTSEDMAKAAIAVYEGAAEHLAKTKKVNKKVMTFSGN